MNGLGVTPTTPIATPSPRIRSTQQATGCKYLARVVRLRLPAARTPPTELETQRLGENRLLLLQDFRIVDLLSHFEKKRIRQRIVHAKGGGAHGYFECSDPLGDLCAADMLSAKRKSCPVSEFSTMQPGNNSSATSPEHLKNC